MLSVDTAAQDRGCNPPGGYSAGLPHTYLGSPSVPGRGGAACGCCPRSAACGSGGAAATAAAACGCLRGEARPAAACLRGGAGGGVRLRGEGCGAAISAACSCCCGAWFCTDCCSTLLHLLLVAAGLAAACGGAGGSPLAAARGDAGSAPVVAVMLPTLAVLLGKVRVGCACAPAAWASGGGGPASTPPRLAGAMPLSPLLLLLLGGTSCLRCCAACCCCSCCFCCCTTRRAASPCSNVSPKKTVCGEDVAGHWMISLTQRSARPPNAPAAAAPAPPPHLFQVPAGPQLQGQLAKAQALHRLPKGCLVGVARQREIEPVVCGTAAGRRRLGGGGWVRPSQGSQQPLPAGRWAGWRPRTWQAAAVAAGLGC